MSILDFIGSIFKPAADLIDNVHTSEEEKLELRNQFGEIKNSIHSKMIGYEIKLLKAQTDVLVAEATGESWLQRNWRPVTMITMLVLVVIEAALNFIGVTPKSPLPDWFGTLFQIGLGGYVVGRSAEKILKGKI